MKTLARTAILLVYGAFAYFAAKHNIALGIGFLAMCVVNAQFVILDNIKLLNEQKQ